MLSFRHFHSHSELSTMSDRLGWVSSCLKHELIHPYPVLFEKKGDHVAHFKFTVLILPSGPTRISGLKPFELGAVKTEKRLSDEISAIMSLASKKKKKKKSNAALKATSC